MESPPVTPVTLSTSAITSKEDVENFYLYNASKRKNDGTLLCKIDAAYVAKPSMLRSERVSTRTLVLTEGALYEFKGSFPMKPGPEHQRYPLEHIRAIVLSFDRGTRFTLCLPDNTSRTFESPLRDTFVATLKSTIASSLGEAPLSVELEDRFIARILKAALSAPDPDAWTALIGTGEPTAVAGGESAPTTPVALSPAPVEGESATLLTSNSDSQQPRVVGQIGQIGPMTLIWRRLGHSILPFFQVASLADEGVKAVTNKMEEAIKSQGFPFSASGAPKSAAEAARSITAVCMDPATCRSLAHAMGSTRAPGFYQAIESNLGCGDEQVRRWCGFILVYSLPVMLSASFMPQTPSWKKAVQDFSRQHPKRDNPVVSILFSPFAEEVTYVRGLLVDPDALVENASEVLAGAGKEKGETPTSGGGGKLPGSKTSLVPSGGTTGGGSSSSGWGVMSRRPQSANKSRPPALAVLGKSTMSVQMAQTSESGGSSSSVTASKGSSALMTTTSGRSLNEPGSASSPGSGAGNAGLVLLPDDLGERRARGALSLLWTTHLLDLENGTHDGSHQDTGGITNLDIQTQLQVLIGRSPDPMKEDDFPANFNVETFGARIEHPELLAAVFASLAATRRDEVRRDGLKQINVLCMRNPQAVKAVLGTTDWQTVILPCLLNVPLDPAKRAPVQEDIFSYAMHLLTSLHASVLGSASQSLEEFGPIDKLVSQTIFKIAVYSGWHDESIDVVRTFLKALFQTFQKTAQGAQCQWRSDPSMEEWEELFRLAHLLQTFVFYRPPRPDAVTNATSKSARRATELFATATAEESTSAGGEGGLFSRPSGGLFSGGASESGPPSDWRTRLDFIPVLSRVKNERFVAVHRQVFHGMSQPVMTAGHRGDDMGIHVRPDGMCADRLLVETALKLWNACGITGDPRKDQLKADEFIAKTEKSRILYASKIAQELQDVLNLFDSVDEKKRAIFQRVKETEASAKKKGKTAFADPTARAMEVTVESVEDFLHRQRKNDVSVGFMSKTKSKQAATKLRANMLRQREVGVLVSATIAEAPKEAVTSVAPVSTGRRGSKGSGYRRGAGGHVELSDSLRRDANAVVAMRADETVVEKIIKNAIPEASEAEEKDSPVFSPTSSRKTLVKLGPAPAGRGLPPVEPEPSILPISAQGRASKAPSKCHGCERNIQPASQEVVKFGLKWHTECLTCSQCHRNILRDARASTEIPAAPTVSTLRVSVSGRNDAKTVRLGDNSVLASCRYYPLAELLLCSGECRDKVLSRVDDARCPSCMDGFNAHEETFRACGHAWHVDLGCFRCVSCDTRLGNERPYFEHKSLPYCRSCFDAVFLTCKACKLPFDQEAIYKAADGSQFHERCFCCSVCRAGFKDGAYYIGSGGAMVCLAHFVTARTPPCALCRRNFTAEDDSVGIAGLAFHRKCFNCSICRRDLSEDSKPGADDEPHEAQGSLYCADCYADNFEAKCYACNKGIRGEILHAGVGKSGEPINWHPHHFLCSEPSCGLPLQELQFYVVTLGDDEIVPVCYEHFQSKYNNSRCPGCQLVVKPNKSKHAGINLAPYMSGGTSTLAKEEVSVTNPSIHYGGNIWHAKCLVCDESECGTKLFFEQSGNRFAVHVVDGKKLCLRHAGEHCPQCFTCGSAIFEDTPMTELMDWTFHDTPACFVCISCKLPIEDGQALRKRKDGPMHATCQAPSTPPESGVFGKASRALSRVTGYGKRSGSATAIPSPVGAPRRTIAGAQQPTPSARRKTVVAEIAREDEPPTPVAQEAVAAPPVAAAQ